MNNLHGEREGAVQENARAGPAMNISQADCGAIFDAVSDAILVHDGATGEILEVNRGMCEMFGYTPEEARRLTVTALGGSAAGAEPALGLLARLRPGVLRSLNGRPGTGPDGFSGWKRT